MNLIYQLLVLLSLITAEKSLAGTIQFFSKSRKWDAVVTEDSDNRLIVMAREVLIKGIRNKSGDDFLALLSELKKELQLSLKVPENKSVKPEEDKKHLLDIWFRLLNSLGDLDDDESLLYHILMKEGIDERGAKLASLIKYGLFTSASELAPTYDINLKLFFDYLTSPTMDRSELVQVLDVFLDKDLSGEAIFDNVPYVDHRKQWINDHFEKLIHVFLH